MPFTTLPTITANQAVRASYAALLKANFDNHEARTLALETASSTTPAAVALDVEALRRAAQGLAVYSGCLVSEAGGGASMVLDISAGHIRLTTGVGLLVTAGTVTIDTAHATNPRLDIVWVNTSGTLGKTTGTAAATPVPPALPSNSVLLALVSVPALDTTISNAQITDKRTFTKLRQIIRKTADESVTSSATLQNDDALLFTIGASEMWVVDFYLRVEGSTTGDLKINIGVPASATYLLSGVAGTIVTAAGTDGDARFISSASSGFDLNYGMIGAASPVPLHLHAIIVNGSTPGSVTLKWAQNVSDGTATKVLTNSHLEAGIP